jgi:hypothetical protein
MLANVATVKRVYNRVGLGMPAGIDAAGNPSDTPAFYVFDDHRIGSNWRVRVAAGPTLFFQEWDSLIGGTQLQELTFAQIQALFA